MSLQRIFDSLPDAEPEYNPEWDQKFSKLVQITDLSLPKLSIVTPSLNHGHFIEQTIRCILLQGYPNLEYIIIDGGSTDGTVDIIKKYEKHIAYWISESDNGMYDALNKGFARSTGEIMAWSPAGDRYEPSALIVVGNVFQQLQEVEWLTSLYKVKCDEAGNETARYKVDGFCGKAFLKGLNFLGGNPYARYMIQQQSTFWRRSLWDKSGACMDASMKVAGDFELWARFFRNGARLYAVDQPVGVFMSHSGQESVENSDQMLREQTLVFERAGGKHMSRLEGYFRSRVLRRRPFTYFKSILPCRFRSDKIHWRKDDSVEPPIVSYFL